MSDDALKPEDLAARWGLSLSTLAHWRCENKGPRFRKIGRKILYPIKDVERFEAKSRV